METTSKQLILKNINKQFGELVAVKDVDLVIAPAEFVCFLGPSGCGKTTLLRIITGFEQQTTGDGCKLCEQPQHQEYAKNYQRPNRSVISNRK